MTIYKSVTGKKKILKLYDEQLGRLKTDYSDKWIPTSFGETHLIETGNPAGIPLLVFHGGNAWQCCGERYDKLQSSDTGHGRRKRLSVSRKKSIAQSRTNHRECHYLFVGGQRSYE